MQTRWSQWGFLKRQRKKNQLCKWGFEKIDRNTVLIFPYLCDKILFGGLCSLQDLCHRVFPNLAVEEHWSWEVEDATTRHLRNSGKNSIVTQFPHWITQKFPMGYSRNMFYALLFSCLFRGIFTSVVSRMQIPDGTMTNRQPLGGLFGLFFF